MRLIAQHGAVYTGVYTNYVGLNLALLHPEYPPSAVLGLGEYSNWL